MLASIKSLHLLINPSAIIVFCLLSCIVGFVCAQSDSQGQSSDTFNTIDSSALNSYKLVAGDRIRINVFGEPELTLTIQLNESGAFSYPYLGRIKATEKTLRELRDLIVEGLKGDYLIDPKVSVTMEGYREFYISGEVVRGGSFPYQPGLTLSRAVALAGGFTERAARKRVKVVAEGTSESDSIKVNLDYLVKPGDVITVPRRFF